MKRLAVLTLAAGSLLSFGNADTILLKSNISDVTIFFSGAQVTRKAELKLKKGRHILFIDQLPGEIIPNSIQSSVPSQFKLLAVKHIQHQQNLDRKTPEEQALVDQAESFDNKIADLDNQINVLNLEEKILLDKSVTEKTAKEFTALQLKEIADFYRSRLNEIHRNIFNLLLEKKSLEEKKTGLFETLNLLTVNKRSSVSRLYVTIDCVKELPGELKLNYYVSSAGWEPLYDFRVEDISKPFVIAYNANVFQSTGENWKNVNIKLSTTNPSLSGERQKLLAWYINRESPYTKNKTVDQQGAIKGLIRDSETKEAIPFANVVVTQNGNQIAVATSNIDGEFYVKPVNPGNCNIKAVYVGYHASEVRGVKVVGGKTAYVSLFLKGGEGMKLDEVVVSSYAVPLIDPDIKSGQTITREEYQNLATKEVNSVAATTAGVYEDWSGARSSNSNYYSDGTVNIETLYLGTGAAETNVSNMEYTVAEPYSIPSDGSDNNIRIKEQSLEVNYIYHAVPKLEADVFLSAEIANWSSLNLISGKSSVYFQDTYVGQSFLDVSHVGDTLTVSLGRDKDVLVNRAPIKSVNNKRINSSSIKETNGMNIVVRNNKNSKIKLIVEDQYPLSSRRSIEIDLLEAPGAKVDERLAKLSWEQVLEPSEKKLLTYSYSLRYPKWARIIAE